ncbi:lipid A-modifier LpxR family protein [Paenirhodobacter sp. CAU 1674]|uniref:lipid A-modifier LpxR family protein n=1 Tax=Paenirhodobacter sp. CAU 1674 TaxID=3032596 RepID=UPI0023DC4D35|nr:lipid A-modifier LpxR family protein [Paenirhodobacter sp. CAU 1674]MDF2142146.1 DUF2219 family protein [Paenirhodobacter sp. CAU 1674]
MRTPSFSGLRALVPLFLAGLAALAHPAQAEGERQLLGVGRFFYNDYFGDGDDRWQTGGYSLSFVRGTGWDGALPTRPFDIMEYRFGGSIIAPSRLRNPPAGDRRYVGRLNVAANTYFDVRGVETRLGFGVTAVGPATGIATLHKDLHDLFSAPRVVVAEDQLPNHLYPTLSAEIGRGFDLAGGELRPFAEARAGDETYLRAGADFSFGARETGALWLRDDVTGHRYVGVSGEGGGNTSFVLGGDIARVFDSVYFPAADGVEPEKTRSRLRAGVSTRIGFVGVFYGLTWLSEEYVGQPEGQILGGLRARVNF